MKSKQHIKLHTHLIHPEGTEFTGQFPTDTLLPEGNNPMFCFTSPASYKIFASMAGHDCVVRGVVAAKGHATCASCLDAFDIVIHSKEFSFFFEASEIPADGEIDITNDLQEELLIEIPDFPKCSEDCRGLCPQCGCNWNHQKCKCKPVEISESEKEVASPFDILKEINIP